MKNKLEVHFIMNANDDVSIEITAHLKGFEAKAATVAILDSMAQACSRTFIEKAAFLKSVQDAMGKLILKTLLNDEY
ncbi:MAG: hypothetical protein K2H19_09025 [Ruminococcus sp.]|nr:hypothetical protein [Ruminococcus sp.]